MREYDAQGTSGGLVLCYSEKAFAVIVSDGGQITVYENADESVQYRDALGQRCFLKIVSKANTCDLLASRDGIVPFDDLEYVANE